MEGSVEICWVDPCSPPGSAPPFVSLPYRSLWRCENTGQKEEALFLTLGKQNLLPGTQFYHL